MDQELLVRLRTVYYLRRLADPVVVKCSTLFGLLLLFWFQVSLLNIFANTPSVTQPSAFYHFFYSAFAETEWLVKTIIIAMTLFMVGLVLPLSRVVRLSRFMPVINLRRFQPFRFNWFF